MPLAPTTRWWPPPSSFRDTPIGSQRWLWPASPSAASSPDQSPGRWPLVSDGAVSPKWRTSNRRCSTFSTATLPSEALSEPSVADRALTLVLEQVVELHLASVDRPDQTTGADRREAAVGQRGRLGLHGLSHHGGVPGTVGHSPGRAVLRARATRAPGPRIVPLDRIEWQEGLVLGTDQLLPLLSNRRSRQMCRLQPHPSRRPPGGVRGEPVRLTNSSPGQPRRESPWSGAGCSSSRCASVLG